jgi:ketosteroid isomerase-like protein
MFMRHADAFNSGDLEAIAASYIQPLAVFIDGEVRLEKTRQDTLDAIFALRAEALARGVRRVRATVRQPQHLEHGRRPVLVLWHFETADGRKVASSRVRYYCVQEPGGEWRVEMVQYLKVAFPNARLRPNGESLLN